MADKEPATDIRPSSHRPPVKLAPRSIAERPMYRRWSPPARGASTCWLRRSRPFKSVEQSLFVLSRQTKSVFYRDGQRRKTHVGSELRASRSEGRPTSSTRRVVREMFPDYVGLCAFSLRNTLIAGDSAEREFDWRFQHVVSSLTHNWVADTANRRINCGE